MRVSIFFLRFILSIFFLNTKVLAAQPMTKLVTLPQYIEMALQSDASYQEALLNQKLLAQKILATDVFYNNSVLLSPYLSNYKLQNLSNYSNGSYSEKGFKLEFSQALPLGTELQLSTDQTFENTREQALAQTSSYSLGLKHKLWSNQFGKADRFFHESAKKEFAASEYKTKTILQSQLLKIIQIYNAAWIVKQKITLVNQATEMAEELNHLSEKNYKKGQIGKLDWLGAQSDFINLQKLKHQTIDEDLAAQLTLQSLVVDINGKTLKNPENYFVSLVEQFSKTDSVNKTSDELYYQMLLETEILKKQGEESKSLPELDLVLSQNFGQGKYGDENYKEIENRLALQLTWYINNKARESEFVTTQVQEQIYKAKLEELERQRVAHYNKQISSIKSQKEQLLTEQKRIDLLDQIIIENKKRYLQGRLEFQDYLRVKEQWIEAQIEQLELQQKYWSQIMEFILQEQSEISLEEIFKERY